MCISEKIFWIPSNFETKIKNFGNVKMIDLYCQVMFCCHWKLIDTFDTSIETSETRKKSEKKMNRIQKVVKIFRKIFQ